MAATAACCKPVLQSSTEQWEMHFALNSVAVHWVTGHLYKQQIFKGVIAATQACCQLVLHSSIGSCKGCNGMQHRPLHTSWCCCWVDLGRGSHTCQGSYTIKTAMHAVYRGSTHVHMSCLETSVASTMACAMQCLNHLHQVYELWVLVACLQHGSICSP